MKDSSEAGDVDDLEPQEPKPLEEAEDASAGAADEESHEGTETETTADDATEKAGDTAVSETADDAGSGAKKTTSGLATEDAKGTVGDATQTAKEAAGDATQTAKEAAPDLSILKGLEVDPEGLIHDHEGKVVGRLVEGDAADLAGYAIGDDGEILDDDGDLVGRCELLHDKVEEPEKGVESAVDEAEDGVEEPEKGVEDAVDETGEAIDDELPGIEALEGHELNSQGEVLDSEGNVLANLEKGADPAKLKGMSINEKGEVIDEDGNVVGKVELADGAQNVLAGLPSLKILENLKVNKKGKILDSEGEILGELIDGDPAECAGKRANDRGEILDKSGAVVGRVRIVPGDAANEAMKELQETLGGAEAEQPEEAEEADDAEEVDEVDEAEGEDEDGLPPLSILEGLKVNKAGKLINDKGITVGELVEGDPKKLWKLGTSADAEGQFWDTKGRVIGKARTVPVEEPDEEGAFAGLEGLIVTKDGMVVDENKTVVGKVVTGELKRLVGRAVDEDGDIIDKKGSVVGHAERYEEPEEEPEPEADLSSLADCTVNKAGKVVDSSGNVRGKVIDGDLKKLIGCKVDGKGQIWNSSGVVVGKATTVPFEDSKEDGPFSGFDSATVAKDGTIQASDGSIIGRLVSGDVKKLVGHKVDEDGDITDKNGNTIGKAERWEPEEKRRKINPMSGRSVNKEGEVRDENGDLMGRLTSGDLGHCIGLEIDDNGYVIDNDGNRVGEVTLLENIAEEEPEEETEEQQKRKQDAELADKMANICQQTLERIQPVMKQITEYIEQADRTPRDELDEDELVNNVKPLIEEGSRILQECNGSLRGLDPDGHIAAQAKGRAATREATPEEFRLADLLKELTTTVVTTIDNAKKKISDMPHAKKKLNPLWGLLTEPLSKLSRLLACSCQVFSDSSGSC
jgi:hypothetical protein